MEIWRVTTDEILELFVMQYEYVEVLAHLLCVLSRPLVAHHDGKLFVADPSISIAVSLSDHLVNLLLCQTLAQGGHHLPPKSNI